MSDTETVEFELDIPTRDQLLEMAAIYLLAEEGILDAMVRLMRIEKLQESADPDDVDWAADDGLDVSSPGGTGDADDAPGLGGHDGAAEEGDIDSLVGVVDNAGSGDEID